jgi:hypothetical protein
VASTSKATTDQQVIKDIVWIVDNRTTPPSS